MHDPRSVPPPKLSPKAAAALARVQQRHGRRRRRAVRSRAHWPWTIVSLLLCTGLAAAAWQRLSSPASPEAAPAAQLAVLATSVAPTDASIPTTVDRPAATAAVVVVRDGAAAAPLAEPRGTTVLDELNRRLQALEGVPPPNCRPRRAIVAAATTAPIHRWRDPGTGHWQFGTHVPAGIAAESVQIQDRAQARFGLAVDAEAGLDLPAQLRDRAAADVVRLTAVLGGELGLVVDPTFQLNVRFVGSPEAVVAGLQLGLARAAGVYRHLDQRIVIWRQSVDQETFRTLRHETTHALLHEFVGAPPLWLNEGLAEYFEGLRTAGSGGRVESNAWYTELLSLAGEGRPGLALEVLGADATPFRDARTAELYYAQSWALVDHLMDSEGGQQLLAKLLTDLRESACGPFSSVAWLDRHYPGGATGLAVAASGQRRLAHSY